MKLYRSKDSSVGLVSKLRVGLLGIGLEYSGQSVKLTTNMKRLP